MDKHIASWRGSRTDADPIGVGSIICVTTFNGRNNTLRYVRVLAEPIPLVTMNRHVNRSTIVLGVWREFRLAFGEMVYDHREQFANEPVWQVYPPRWSSRPQDPAPARPAAVAWRYDPDRGYVIACICIGDPGQCADEFRLQVLEALPQPMPLDERFGMLPSPRVRVLVAAEPSAERDALVELLKTDARIAVTTADTATEVDQQLETADVMIVADQLPATAGGKPEATYCLGHIEDRNWHRKPLVGWPVNEFRLYLTDYRRSSPTFVAEHMLANCRRVLGWMPDADLSTLLFMELYESERGVFDLILDALGVPSTITALPSPVT